MNFIWSPYEVNNKFLCNSNKFHVKLWINGFIWTSYEWASRSIVEYRLTLDCIITLPNSTNNTRICETSELIYIFDQNGLTNAN